MERLTEAQQRVVEFIARHGQEQGYPPTLREIGAAFRIRSTNGVRDHLVALARKGYLTWLPGRRRSLRLVGPGQRWLHRGWPIIGRVAAGTPILAEANLEGTLNLEELFGVGRGVYVLRVKGDSMAGAGIVDGDYVVVRQQDTVEDGAIGVAIVEGEATVKRITKRRGRYVLTPANPKYEPIVVRPGVDFRLGGKVIGVVRRMGHGRVGAA